MAFQVTIKTVSDVLEKGDLVYWRRKLMKVISLGKHKDGSVQERYRIIGQVVLRQPK